MVIYLFNIDFSPKGIRDIVIDRYGPDMGEDLLKNRYKIVK